MNHQRSTTLSDGTPEETQVEARGCLTKEGRTDSNVKGYLASNRSLPSWLPVHFRERRTQNDMLKSEYQERGLELRGRR
jgi:hypothetical protein